MKQLVVCDDEPHIVEGLRHLLRKPNRAIHVANGGQQALDLVRAHHANMLVIDIMMPGMSGLEVVSTLRSTPDFKDLPIIILTAKGQAKDAVMAQEVWGVTVMTKPFQPAMLKQLVSEILEGVQCR